MKTIKSSGLIVALTIVCLQIMAQQVASCDIVATIKTMPILPKNIGEAYQIAYAKDAAKPNAEGLYTEWFKNLEAAVNEGTELSKKFYLKNPTGIAPKAQPVQNNVSASQKASMEAVRAEMMQKVMSDPAFAQKLMKMSEAEQREYFTKVLAEKGIVEKQGTHNMTTNQPAGMDVNWLEICSEFSQTALDRSLFDAQQAIQARYIPLHNDVNKWAEGEIKKLPLILMGEYGRDRDPEKVKAIQRQALQRHKEVADKEWQELVPILMQQREQRAQFAEKLTMRLSK
jgi:hypothetical protein